MERTARLVRIARANLPISPDPWLRGAADVAAAVGWSSGKEGAHAAGGGPADIAAAVARSGGGSGKEGYQAAGGGPADIAAAVARSGGGSSKEGAQAAGGGPADIAAAVARSGGGYGKEAAGGGRVLAHAVGRAGDCSGRGGALAVVRMDKGANLGQGDGVRCLLRDLGGSRATGPGRGRSLAASPLARGHDSPAAPSPSQLGAARYSSVLASNSNTSVPATNTSVLASTSSTSAPATVADTSVAALFSSAAMGPSSIHSERVRPLVVIHDKDWASKEGFGEDGSTQVNVSEMITSTLKRHKGSVYRFQIDSSKWTDSKCLDNWVNVLSEKSIEELILLNLGHEAITNFPIQDLQSKKLRILSLGFLAMNLDLPCFNYNALEILDLFCCAFESNKLSWIVTDCVSLKELRVQYCSVDLKISSTSLENLHSVGNIGNRIVIESAPKLLDFVSEMTPNQNCRVGKQKMRASISINNAPSLKLIKHLSLPYHNITINRMDITKDIGSLHCLIVLQLSLEMAKASQLQHLRKLLESFPVLQELCIVRMDDVGCDEWFDIWIDKPFEDLGVVDSMKKCLTRFSLLEFQGGPSERHLIQSILKSAPNLMQLHTSRSASASKNRVRKAANEIRNYERVSERCTVIFE